MAKPSDDTRYCVRTLVRMTPDMRQQLENLAERKQMPYTVLMRQALLEYFERHDTSVST